MSASSFVSVIIPVYNDAPRLNRCLEALERQTYPGDRFEVIVIDNGSEDDPRADRFPRVRWLSEPVPGSYRARNKGVIAARGEILAFTDSDCLPEPDWLEKGVARLKSEDCCAAAGAIVHKFSSPGRPSALELFQTLNEFLQEIYVAAGFGASANLIVAKSAFERFGPFADHLKSSGDAEWGQRATARGGRIVYVPEALVRHPTRTFAGVLRKRLRLAGGWFQKNGIYRESLAGKLGMIRRSLTPDIRKFRSEFKRHAVYGRRIQWSCMGIYFSVQAVQALEEVRLQLGGSPLR